MQDFLKEQVRTRRAALKLQLDKEEQARKQAENNINAIHGALQDVEFWENQINGFVDAGDEELEDVINENNAVVDSSGNQE
jgi:hypothetical protein